MRQYRAIVFSMLAGVACAKSAAAQSQAPEPTTRPATQEYVTREEYERLRAELESVRPRVEAAPADQKRRGGAGSLFDNDRFLVTGYAFAGFSDEHAGGNTFSAGLAPIFLWRVTDKIFVEAEVELGLNNESGDGETEVNLEYADINFIINDYMTLRAGKFLTPFGQFPERLHPAWINKLPDFPLAYAEEGGLVPFSSLGAEVRGAVLVHPGGFDSKLVYAAYVANGPSLVTDDEEGAGTLDDANYDDNNNNKTVGGRIGFLPFPELEVGYSIMYGDVADGTTAVLNGVDVSYVRDIDAIAGTIDARAEWIWSNVETVTFDETGAGGFGPLTFSNKRNGGYAQLAYRPTQLDNKILRSTEFVTRYDNLHVPGEAPGQVSTQRVTFGVDYWATSNVVIKAAYRLDDPERGEHNNALLLQVAVGF